MPERTVQLGDVATIFAGFPTKNSDQREIGRPGNVLTVRSLTGTGIDLDQLEAFDDTRRGLGKYRVQPGDLLISSRSTSLKTAIVPEDLDGYLINATVIGIRSLPLLLPRLLVAWLEGPEGKAELDAVSQSGTAQMNITVAGLSRLNIPLPDISVQRKLAELLSTADSTYQLEIEVAETRRQIAQEIVISQLRTTTN